MTYVSQRNRLSVAYNHKYPRLSVNKTMQGWLLLSTAGTKVSFEDTLFSMFPLLHLVDLKNVVSNLYCFYFFQESWSYQSKTMLNVTNHEPAQQMFFTVSEHHLWSSSMGIVRNRASPPRGRSSCVTSEPQAKRTILFLPLLLSKLTSLRSYHCCAASQIQSKYIATSLKEHIWPINFSI